MSGSSADEDTSSSRESVENAAFITPAREADGVLALGVDPRIPPEEEDARASSSSAAGSPPVQGAIKAPKKSPPAADDAKGGASEQRRDEQSSRAGETYIGPPSTLRNRDTESPIRRQQIHDTIVTVENMRQQLNDTISTVDAMRRQIDQSGNDVTEMKGLLKELIALQQGAVVSNPLSTSSSQKPPTTSSSLSPTQTASSRESPTNNSQTSTGARTATVGSTELTNGILIDISYQFNRNVLGDPQ